MASVLLYRKYLLVSSTELRVMECHHGMTAEQPPGSWASWAYYASSGYKKWPAVCTSESCFRCYTSLEVKTCHRAYVIHSGCQTLCTCAGLSNVQAAVWPVTNSCRQTSHACDCVAQNSAIWLMNQTALAWPTAHMHHAESAGDTFTPQKSTGPDDKEQ